MSTRRTGRSTLLGDTPITSKQTTLVTPQDKPHGGLGEALSSIENKVEKALTVFWDDLPTWQQDNHYIQSGYRPATGSYRKSFASLGYLHNESVNIYTHLIGAVLFAISTPVVYNILVPRYHSATTADVLVFGCFFLGAVLCLGCSATFHTITNHSPSVNSIGNQLDYLGIVLLITGSFVPSVYYGFFCLPRVQIIYWTMVLHSAESVF